MVDDLIPYEPCYRRELCSARPSSGKLLILWPMRDERAMSDET